jgi:hypothetical protein
MYTRIGCNLKKINWILNSMLCNCCRDVACNVPTIATSLQLQRPYIATSLSAIRDLSLQLIMILHTSSLLPYTHHVCYLTDIVCVTLPNPCFLPCRSSASYLTNTMCLTLQKVYLLLNRGSYLNLQKICPYLMLSLQLKALIAID